MKIKNRFFTIAIILLCSIFTLFVFTGCFGGGDNNSNTASNAITVEQSSYQIKYDSEDVMANGAMVFTVKGVERRPLSMFSGASIQGGQGMDGTKASQVGISATTDIAIQVDIEYRWNVNTYISAVTAAGGQASSTPSTLGDVLIPGTLMYVLGNDIDGNTYMSADIISPSAQKDVNALAINSSRDYDILHSPLPETSTVQKGSFILRVPSTVNNLRLVIITPMGGQDFTNVNNIANGSTATFELPLA